MSLTLEEISLVTSLWEKVTPNKRVAGRQLFKILFAENPDIQDKFVFARGLTWEEIESKPTRIDAHAASVINSVSALVENMDSPEVVKELLHKTGASHRPRDVTVENLKALGDALIQTFTVAFGKEVMTPETVNAWTKFYSLVLSEMGAEL